MKVRVTVTIDIDEKEWATEYGIDSSHVREDIRHYVRDALYSMPVAPRTVELKP